MDKSVQVGEDQLIAYWWKYDDKTYGLALLEKSNKKHERLVRTELLDSRNDLEVLLKSLEVERRHDSRNLKAEKDKQTLEKKKLKLHCGLQYFRDHDKPKRSKKRGIYGQQELKSLLHSCGDSTENRREVLRLFSGILSGYCARIIIPIIQEKCPSVLQDRAPILRILGANKVFDFMLQTISALAVSTDYGNSVLKSNSVSFFPSSVTQRSFEDCAALRVRKGKGRKARFSVQYRDTAVLIHGKFFQEKKIRSFVRRNRWVSCVLLDVPKKSCDVVPIKLNANLLSCIDFRWDNEGINYLVERFVCFLADLENELECDVKIRKKLKRVESHLFKYIDQQDGHRFSPTEAYFHMLWMLTLDLFLESCKKDGVFDKKTKAYIQATWFDLLLPGCCEIPDKPNNQDGLVEEPISDPKKDAVQIFEMILTKMLKDENLDHFPYIAQGEPYDLRDPDSGIEYWGYLRNYPPQRNWKKAFPALIFRVGDFERVFASLLEDNDDPKFLIRALRKSDATYCYTTDKMAFPQGAGDTKKEGALILKINEMVFLTDEVKKALLDKIPVKKDEDKGQ